MPSLEDYDTADNIVFWAKANLRITNPIDDHEIKRIMRWIGFNAVDTMFPNNTPVFGRIGIGLMLSVTLLEFPDYYVKCGLAQFN